MYIMQNQKEIMKNEDLGEKIKKVKGKKE